LVKLKFRSMKAYDALIWVANSLMISSFLDPKGLQDP